jgi:hypothetical protein
MKRSLTGLSWTLASIEELDVIGERLLTAAPLQDALQSD